MHNINILQWMVIGQTGQSGQVVLSRAALDWRQGQEHVPTQHHKMAVSSVMERALKRVHVDCKDVQVCIFLLVYPVSDT